MTHSFASGMNGAEWVSLEQAGRYMSTMEDDKSSFTMTTLGGIFQTPWKVDLRRLFVHLIRNNSLHKLIIVSV